MTKPQTIENIFGAFVNQGSLEDAATWMANLAVSYPDLENEFIVALSAGIDSGLSGDSKIILAVNKSGYQVSTPQEAGLYCSELLTLFRKALSQSA